MKEQACTFTTVIPHYVSEQAQDGFVMVSVYCHPERRDAARRSVRARVRQYEACQEIDRKVGRE